MPTPSNRTPIRIARGTTSNLNSSISDIQEGEIVFSTDDNKLLVKEGSSLTDTQSDASGKANIASPTFTGTPAAPTAAQGTNTTQLATTAFVNAEIAADTATKAPLADPTFTGTPAAPTASTGTNTTQIATTAFVQAALPTVDPDTAKTDVAQTFVPTQTFTAASVHNGGLTVDGPYEQVAEAVSALDIDMSTGNYFTKTISGNSTFTFSNPPASGTVGSFLLELTHSGGSITFPSTVKWPEDTAPTFTAGKTHLLMFTSDDNGSRYRGAALVDYVN